MRLPQSGFLVKEIRMVKSNIYRFRLVFIIFLLAGGVSLAEGIAATTVFAAKNGKVKDCRFWKSEWNINPAGGVSETDIENVLYADCYVGGGDFRVDATLALESLEGSHAGFVMNETDVFGLCGADGYFSTQGRRWGWQRFPLKVETLIKAGVPFQFIVERKGDNLSVSINDTLVYTTPFLWRWGGEMGFRNVRILDFSVVGIMLSAEEYVYNSKTFAVDTGPLTIKSVALPEESAVPDNNWHTGWPVAVKTGNSMVVVFTRKQHHHGSTRPSYPTSSGAVVMRSTDGGGAWSKPFDLRSVIQRKAEHIPGGMMAIGASSEGTILVIGSLGAFRSEDGGVSWKHYPDAFDKFNKEEGVVGHNLGPKIVETSDGKLLAFAHVSLSGGKWADSMLCWISEDDGCSWRPYRWEIPAFFHPVEPAVLLLDDTLYVLGRSHSPSSFDAKNGLFSMVQLVLPIDEKVGGSALDSNIRTTYAFDVMTSLAPPGKDTALGGFWSQDTPGIIYNPMTRRIEAVVSNRTGGGQGEEQDITIQSLNLWSIDPVDFKSGRAFWTFEATLLQRNTMDVTKLIDGMHPAATVVDEDAGVQHIFVYLGYYNGPSGIFQITRPLDTSLVASWWDSKEQIKSASRVCAERKCFSAVGAAIITNSIAPRLLEDGRLLHVDGSSMDASRGNAFWNDVRENGVSLRVPVGAQAPQVISNAVNKRPVLRFRSADNTCVELSAAQSATFTPEPSGLTFIIAFKPFCFNDEWERLIYKGNTKWSGHEGFSINLTSFPGGYGRVIARAAAGNGSRCAVQTHSRTVDSGLMIYSAVLEQDKGWDGYLNGGMYLTGQGAMHFGPKETFSGKVKPSDNLGIGTGFDGEIAEIIIYDRALCVAELNQINAYLKQKYDLKYPDIIDLD